MESTPNTDAGSDVVTFERMTHGPNAVGRLENGKVVMAPGVAPGDRARVTIVRDHRAWIEAEATEIVSRHESYREPPCRHARSGECGGCAWQHLTEDAQHREKQALVEREFARVAPEAEIRPIRTDVPPFGYRRRTKLGHRDGMLGYRKRGERRIFDVWACPVLVEPLELALDEIREAVSDWRSGNVDVMVDAEGQIVVGGPAQSFMQPSAVTEKVLVELVLEAIPDDADDVEELFAGTGTFTIPLLERGHGVRAYEFDPQTVKALARRAPGASVVRADLLKPGLELDMGSPDAILLDPPRKGALPCLPSIAACGVPVICYVSCEPMTLCRDIGALHKFGYRVDWVQPIDAFPQTEHIECVTRLHLT